MIKKIKIKPSKTLLKHWVDTLIPPYDVFFFQTKTNIKEIDNKLITINNYIKNFSDIKYINSYEHWNVKLNSKFVYVDYKNDLLDNTNYKDFIFEQQIKCCRGLILQDNTILTNWLFKTLNYKEKEKLTIKYAQEIDDWIGYNNKVPLYIKKVANKFVKDDGCNCLAVAIYGASNNAEILSQWIQEDDFIKKLKELKYKKVKDIFKSNDIIIFKNKQNILHACYCVDNKLFLNKSGQSRFNPIVLLPFNEIKKDWDNCEIEIYRKI